VNLPSVQDALAGWRALLDALGEPAWLVDARALQVLAVNAEALALLGLPAAAVLGQAADALIATPEDLAYWDEVRAAAAQPSGHGPGPLLSDTSLVDAGGRLVQVSRRIRAMGPADAVPQAYLVVVHDRSAAQHEADARELLLSELQATLESTADGILVTDLAGQIRAFNRRFAQIWGLPESLLTERQDEAVYDWMRRSVVDPEAYCRRL
jgi:PAS domain-containing protein